MFSLLPVKSGFTISYIPISSMFLLTILKSLGLSDWGEGDGRDLDHTRYWRKYFNTRLAETRASRTFGNRIMTDGYAVSALIQCRVSLDTSKGKSDSSIEDIQEIVNSADPGTTIRVVGIDPGFTDIITAAFDDGTKACYSSAKYYHQSKVKHSQRSTARMNAKTSDATDRLLAAGQGGFKTTDLVLMTQYMKAYLGVIREVLVHRLTQSYRQLRFLRYVHKQKTVDEIVDLIVGDKKDVGVLTLVGFGNWSGGSRSPISRQHAGPVQMIKDKVGKRPNACIKSVDEHNTSKLDSFSWTKLVNMRAKETVRVQKDGGKKRMFNVKVHQVLHCKPSDDCKPRTCKETTWNRDVNASRNILMLFQMELKGLDRPAPFCRAKMIGKRQSTTCTGSGASGDALPDPSTVILLTQPLTG
jgi:hypothetical protein